MKNSPGAIGKRSITQVGFGNHIIQQSIDRETGDGLDARLAGDVLAVGNNRMDRYEILVGDLPVSQAPGDGNEDLAPKAHSLQAVPSYASAREPAEVCDAPVPVSRKD